MTNPSDVPQPQQPGAEPPASNVPPAGNQPPQVYQAPGQGYQAPGQGYQAPGQPAQSGGFQFEMPKDGPKSFSDVLPTGGFSGMFSVTGLPTELKVSYWIWLIGGLLGLLGGIIAILASFVLFAALPGLAVVVLLLVLVALALAAAQIVLAMKMKEGREWARLALTIVAGISLVLVIINGSILPGQSGNWLGFVISLAATVLMWLPNAQAWFAAVKGRA